VVLIEARSKDARPALTSDGNRPGSSTEMGPLSWPKTAVSGGAGVVFDRMFLNLNWQQPMAKVSPAQFVRQVRQEINRISWASRRETGTATLTVFIMTAIAALFFLLVDWLLSNGVQFVLGLGG
jgi:preprotein translocase subunit SecE